jgi:nucleotide-binding universal stress UspA family protein
MVTIDHVICPVDLSPASAHALRQATAWARRYDASLRVLYVAPLPQVLVGGVGQSVLLPTAPFEATRTDVEKFVAATLPDEPRPSIDVIEGHAVTAILEEAARRPHSLVVMGTHGWTGLDRVLLGSTTERVAHSTTSPLLVVPPHDRTDPTSSMDVLSVLCAVDFQPSSLAGLQYALSLAQEGRARLELVTVLERSLRGDAQLFRPHVPPDDGARRTELLNALRERVPDDARQWCLVHEQVLTGSPADALLACADEIEAQLIVIGTGDRPHLHALWLGSTTGRILRSAGCPVLIVPGPQRVAVEDAEPLTTLLGVAGDCV